MHSTMEMGRAGNGGGNGKVVLTLNDAVTAGRRRNGSLSSYLDVSRDAGGGGGRAAPRPLPAPAVGSRRRTYADGELDVFAAERYFKGAMDGDGGCKDGVVGVGVATHAAAVETAAAAWPAEARARAVVIAKTSSSSTRASTASLAASSASSANSQTALFRGGRHRRRGSGSGDKKCCVQVGVLMRTCSGKRSVRVDGGASATATKEVHDTAEPAASRVDWYRELRMQKAALGYAYAGDGNSHGLAAGGLPPSLNLGTAKVAAIGREVATTTPAREEKEKAAAEVIMSPSSLSRSFTLVAPVRANVVPAAASGRVVGDPGGGGVGGDGGGKDDDDDGAGSESSSDLFEIKSLMIEDCPYEPSEASVQWSMVTADASSERGDRAVSARWVSGGGTRAPSVPVAGRPPRDHRPGGLLAGCASHRAVDVSAAATKAVPPVRRSQGFHKARNGG